MPEEPEQRNESAAEPDRVLVERATKGDRDAFAQLVHRYIRLVTAAARASVGVHDAEDLAQDVFIEAWKGLPSLREKDRFAAWLMGITRRKAVYRLRRRKRRDEIMDDIGQAAHDNPPGPDTPDAQAERSEALRLLDSQLDLLPEPYREVILMRYMAGLGIDEMAELLGISRAACDKRLTRAKSRLKELMYKKMGDH